MRSRKLVSAIALLAMIFALTLTTTVHAEGDKTEIQIYSNPFGHSTYVLSFALAEIINKNSKDLHATCLESKGSDANLLFMQMNPDARAHTIVLANPFAIRQAERGDPPFKTPFSGMKVLSIVGNMGGFFLTTNPEIKSIEDLAGKRLGLGPKGNTLDYIPRFLLQDGYGIFDKIGRVAHTTFDGIKDGLADGLMDVGLQSSVMWGDGEEKEWAPIPSTEELLATKKCYLVDLDPVAFKKAREATGYPIYALKAKPLAFGKTDAFGGNRIWWSNSWWVHKSMKDDVVREICAILYAHAAEFASYHASGRGITPNTLSNVAVPAEDFHPAAARFYQEKGLKVGEQ